jgi:hypothetical protein
MNNCCDDLFFENNTLSLRKNIFFGHADCNLKILVYSLTYSNVDTCAV